MNELPTQLNDDEPCAFAAIGLPRDMVDVNALAKHMGLPFKPATAADISAAMSELEKFRHQQTRSPLRRHVAANRLKGSEKMPAVATPQVKTTPIVARIEPSPSRLQPQIIAPNLKSGLGPAELRQIGWSIQATASMQTNQKNPVIEARCRALNIPLLNTATTTTPSKGGYATPDGFSAAIIKRRARAGTARKVAFQAPMTSGNETLPRTTGALTVEYLDEAPSVSPTGSDITWGAVNLIAKKRGVTGYLSQELHDDALIRFVDEWIEDAAHVLAKNEDRELTMGDGTSGYGGVVGLISSLGSAGISACGAGHDTYLEVDIADIVTFMAKLPEDFADGREEFICSSAFFASVMLRLSNGFQGVSEDGRPTFLGKVVNIVPTMPSMEAASQIACLYGNFSQAAVLGDRGLLFTFSDKTPVAFERGLIAMKAFSRYSIVIHNAGDASAAGAYVGLRLAA